MSEYPSDFEKWAKSNPWMQENKAEAYELWKRRRTLLRPKPTPPKKKTKAKAKPSKKKKRPKKRRARKANSQYLTYIKSAEWREKSRIWRMETGQCEICGSTDRLQCHHKHYRTLGKEKREDIQVVCYKCHCKLHGVVEFKNFKKKK